MRWYHAMIVIAIGVVSIQGIEAFSYKTTSTCIEDPLFNFCLSSRGSNIFCLIDGSNCDLGESTTHFPVEIATLAGTNDDANQNVTNITYAKDGLTYNVSEAMGADPLTIEINFTDITSFSSMLFRLWYQGGQGHEIAIGLYDFDDGEWEEEYGEITDMNGYAFIPVSVWDPNSHIAPWGNVSLRFRHVQNGISSHDFIIDYAVLIEGFSVTTTNEHDSFTGRDNLENHPQYFDTDGTRVVTKINVTNDVDVYGNHIIRYSDGSCTRSYSPGGLRGTISERFCSV